jgi:aspartyl aminopeptidase
MAKKVTTKKKASPKTIKVIKKNDPIAEISKDAWSLDQLEGITHQVLRSKSSVFSKEDVVALLGEIKDAFKNRKEAPKVDVESLIDEITENICDNACVDDLDTFDLELSGNSIEIDSIKLRDDTIREYVSDIVTSYF